MAIHPLHSLTSVKALICWQNLSVSRSLILSALVGAGICLPVALAQPRQSQSQDAQSSQSGSQDSSVADAARRSREKKKDPSGTSKSHRVITDDDLDRQNFKPGQEGLNVGAWPKLETEPPSAKAVAAAEAADNATEQDLLKEAKQQDSEIAGLKLQIAQAERDLDLVRRELALDQDSYFANPDYVHDVGGKAKLDSEKQQINDKQQDIERLKTRLAAVEELKSRRKSARTQEAPAPTSPTENAPTAQNPGQPDKPAQTENPPGPPPQL